MDPRRTFCTLICIALCLAGCERYPSKVDRPPISETVAEGKKSLHYRTDTSGIIYLERVKRKQFLWKSAVKPGDEVIVDLDAMQLRVNGQVQRDVEIELATYRLLFTRATQ